MATTAKNDDDWDIDDGEVWRKAPKLFAGVTKKKEKDQGDWDVKDSIGITKPVKKGQIVGGISTKMSGIKIEEKKR